MTQIQEAAVRAQNIFGSKEKIARFINAEFHMSAYVSKGKDWAQYRKEQGELKTQVIA